MTIKDLALPSDLPVALPQVLAAAKQTRAVAAASVAEAASGNGDKVHDAFGVADVIYALEVDDDRLRGIAAGVLLAVCAAFGVGLARNAFRQGFGFGLPATDILPLLTAAIAAWFALTAVVALVPIFLRLRDGHGGRLPLRLACHAGRMVAIGDRAVYLRDFDGAVHAFRYPSIRGVEKLHFDSTLPSLRLLGAKGKVLAVLDDMDAADAGKVADEVEGRIAL